MFRRLTVALLPLALASPAFAQNTSAPVSTPEFLTMAAQSDQFEIQEGQLAEKKGSASVKQFGEHMVRDHNKTTAGLMQAVQKAGMSPPPPTLRPDQMNMITQLQGLSGAEFDRAYMAQQVEAHQQALNLMVNYIKTGDSAPIKAAAQEAAPIVEMHLRMAEKMAKASS